MIFNLFESGHQFQIQIRNLNIDTDYEMYAVGYVEIRSGKLARMSPDKQMNLYTSSLQMVNELAAKYMTCHVLSLDTMHFCMIFFLKGEMCADYKTRIKQAFHQVAGMLYNYYSVTIVSSVGAPVDSLMQISASYHDARQIFPQVDERQPILFFDDAENTKPLKNVFNIALFKEDIRKAYAEFDEKALYDIFTSIIDLFEGRETHYVQALDAACNILYLSLSLLNNGEQIVSEIFKDKSSGYRSLYEITNVDEILNWLKKLRDGLCFSFSTYNKDYKNHIVKNVKKYIVEHVEEKFTLNKAAEVFNISPNYLSVLFSKYNDTGFSDYVNQCKIEAAKKMLEKGDLKIYEISDRLGFESAFYFSRVFKKVTGLSPRDYMNQNI